MHAVAELWAHGCAVDWQAMHRGKRCRVSLPGYPFQRQRYWIDACRAAAPPSPRIASLGQHAASGTDARNNITDWYYEPVWRPVAIEAPGPTTNGPWLVIARRMADMRGLVLSLQDQGQQVITVMLDAEAADAAGANHVIDPHAPAAWQQPLRYLRQSNTFPRRIVLWWDEHRESDDLAGFLCILRLTQALAEAMPSHGVDLAVVTSGTARIADRDAILPTNAMLPGACLGGCGGRACM
jgi:phthiocerol/phenolphthiocerol synthesis type-I polyketide synthase E